MKKITVPAIVRRVLTGLLALSALGFIFWLDFYTGILQQRVILAGVAGSLATFLLTYLVMDIFLHRARERRWASVTGLALTDILRAFADEERSEVSRGKIVPHSMRIPERGEVADVTDTEQWGELLALLMTERDLLTHRLASWWPFLASSSDNEEIMQHVAKASLGLDAIREAIVKAETYHLAAEVADPQELTAVAEEIDVQVRHYNEHLSDLVEAVRARLDEFQRSGVVAPK